MGVPENRWPTKDQHSERLLATHRSSASSRWRFCAHACDAPEVVPQVVGSAWFVALSPGCTALAVQAAVRWRLAIGLASQRAVPAVFATYPHRLRRPGGRALEACVWTGFSKGGACRFTHTFLARSMLHSWLRACFFCPDFSLAFLFRR